MKHFLIRKISFVREKEEGGNMIDSVSRNQDCVKTY